MRLTGTILRRWSWSLYTCSQTCSLTVHSCENNCDIILQPIAISPALICLNVIQDRNFISSFLFLIDVIHVRWVPVPTAWRVLGLRMEERPPAMEGSWEYIEYAAEDTRQGVDL
jgi:hypothetical protein